MSKNSSEMVCYAHKKLDFVLDCSGLNSAFTTSVVRLGSAAKCTQKV